MNSENIHSKCNAFFKQQQMSDGRKICVIRIRMMIVVSSVLQKCVNSCCHLMSNKNTPLS